MNEEARDKSTEQELIDTGMIDTTLAVKEVEEAKDVVGASVSDANLSNRVADLRTMLDNLSEEVEGWKTWHKNDYLSAIETIKSEVEEIQNEWNTVSGNVSLLQEKLESLLQSVPGVIDTATLKGLTIRVNHLEQLVSQLVTEAQGKEITKGTRRQFIISLVALGVTIILWVVFIILNILKC